jgi:predicted RNase H-like HicB family nuclease
MARYFAVLDGKPGAFGISVPDLPGCTAMGHDEDEAYRNAIEAVGEWVRDARESGAAPPEPRPLAAIRRDAEVIETLAEGGAFISVPLIIESGRPAKANLSLDSGLLDAIDDAARESGLTRSGFIASAVRAKIVQA